MELTKTKIIIYAVIGIIILVIAALVISMNGKGGNASEDGNLLSHQAKAEHYDIDNRGKDGGRYQQTRGGDSNPLRGGQAGESEAELSYGRHTSLGYVPDERRMGSIPDLDIMGEDELDRIQREIEEENRSYAQRQQLQEDSISRANINKGVRQLTGKDAPQAEEEDAPKGEKKGKNKKTKGNGQEKVATETAVPQSRFSDVTIHRTAKTNAIKAFVHSQQVVRQGSTLKMRVAEDCLTDDGQLLEKNSFVYGIVKKIDGERVDVEITNVNVRGNILPFNKIVYSSDAQRGIRVTNTAKSQAAQEAAGEAVDAASTNTMVTGGGLVGAGVGIVQGAIQGTKRVISKNIKDVKVTIKTNYELLFMEPEEADSSDDFDD